ncbi:MAG: hypothetical protein ACYSYU_11260 [Planctomycetota bacterium]
MRIAGRKGHKAEGWGETPLSVQWAWPSTLGFEERCRAMEEFCHRLGRAWAEFEEYGHPMELGARFLGSVLPELLSQFNSERGRAVEPMPWLAALICCSAFDIALHDAYGRLWDKDIYATYNADFMNVDLSGFLEPAEDVDFSFAGRYPCDFLRFPRAEMLPAWHLVGGKDLLDDSEPASEKPDDGYPALLTDWIKSDGLKCLKVKLRGNDSEWDYQRLVKVGKIAVENGVQWLSSDFNCTVKEPAYVNDILDRLMTEHRGIYQMILYVEQPFGYDLEKDMLDVHSVSERKPLFMDESAHDWKLIRLGRRLGWTGVALKTCKSQTGAILSLCWSKAHKMALMVQDLTNPMLAQIPHVLLASYAETIMGVETNSMQFYPAASAEEEVVHPGLYKRRGGKVELSTLKGPGFGYRVNEIARTLPALAARFEK